MERRSASLSRDVGIPGHLRAGVRKEDSGAGPGGAGGCVYRRQPARRALADIVGLNRARRPGDCLAQVSGQCRGGHPCTGAPFNEGQRVSTAAADRRPAEVGLQAGATSPAGEGQRLPDARPALHTGQFCQMGKPLQVLKLASSWLRFWVSRRRPAPSSSLIPPAPVRQLLR